MTSRSTTSGNGPDYINVRKYANFDVAPQDMDERYTCASCLKPLAPFIMQEKGMPLDAKVERKINATLASAENPPREQVRPAAKV